MKALVLTDYFKFEYKDVPVPEYGDDEVLVKVGLRHLRKRCTRL